MHEVGIMESALRIVLRHAVERQAQRVDRIVLRVGDLAGIEPEALRFAFETLSRGTPAEGATLAVEGVRAVVHCAACRRDFEVGEGTWIYECPTCGSLCHEIRRGRELELSRIELT